MSNLLEQFLLESRELLETAGQGLLSLEDAPEDKEVMNSLFRTVHTIKGASGIFDIEPFTNAVHAAEDVLDEVREGSLDISPEMVDSLFGLLDQVSSWLDELETNEVLGEEAASIGASLASQLRGYLKNDTTDCEESTKIPTQEFKVDVDWVRSIPQETLMSIFKKYGSDNCNLIALSYTPDEECFFSGSDPFLTVRQVEKPLWQSVKMDDATINLSEFDPFQCRLCFDILTEVDEGELQKIFLYAKENVWMSPISIFSLVYPSGLQGDPELYRQFLEDAKRVVKLEDWGTFAKIICNIKEVSGPDTIQGAAIRWMEVIINTVIPSGAILRYLIDVIENGEESKRLFKLCDIESPSPAREDDEPNLVEVKAIDEHKLQASTTQVLGDIKLGLEVVSDPSIWNGVAASAGVALKRVLQTMKMDSDLERLEAVMASAIKARTFDPLIQMIDNVSGKLETVSSKAGSPAKGSQHKTTILRVEQERVDRLMDLAGELVVAKNSLPFLARKAEHTYGVRELGREIKNQFDVIDRIADELQTAVMQVRMVPVGQVFQRFSRLVRDVSRKLEKNVKLVISGEDTEIDKNIVENLADPLVHLIRNSLDHGIESPEVREREGKPKEAILQLKATPMDDRVLIEVIDDGKGIDPEIIKRKAVEKGMIDPDQADSMEETEVLQLIMNAGFSTNDTITDMSGRGVGMDVVRNMVEGNGGSIALKSEVGKGTTVQVFLPLSMAVTQVMTIDVGDACFGISIDNIVETVRVPVEDIKPVNDCEAVVLRDRLIPLVRLKEVLHLTGDEEPYPTEEIAILVVSIEGNEIGLVVDRFNAGVDILLKPLEGMLSNYKLYSGTALMGDGSVLLVLNLVELLKCR